MRDPLDMTVLNGVTGVGGRWWQPCPSSVTAVLRLAYSPTFGFGVVHAKR